ncbi:MAG: DNA primase [Nanoarchaeota archaeon]|nr:DNA primase [Nanoarchaeota archaeon]
MGKISPVSIKYMIYATFEAEGPLEKPDVIGAIFGQTEGLLGSDLEMRELQKEGKIGRIEVELNSVEGKTVGEIRVPSALDKSETTIIAATLETIDRIGPTEAKIRVSKIEDVRGSKREYIIERAKKLLIGLEGSGEIGIAKTIKEESRIAKIQEYGNSKLPAGDISGDEIIVVEGRADVVNLLKNRVNNVISMNGAKMPKDIAVLGEEKELTLFVDGDRGGKLIAKNVIENADVTYVAFAPDGKEVEELTGKEILQSLRKKILVEEFLKREMRGGRLRTRKDESFNESVEEFEGDVKKAMQEKYSDIKGKRKALLIDVGFNVIKEVSLGDLINSLRKSSKKIFAVIIDGAATKNVIEACDEKEVSHLGAKNFSAIEARVDLVSL